MEENIFYVSRERFSALREKNEKLRLKLINSESEKDDLESRLGLLKGLLTISQIGLIALLFFIVFKI